MMRILLGVITLLPFLPAVEFPFTSVSYLGDASDQESVTGVVISADGSLVVAVRAGTQTPALSGARSLAGATGGSAVVRLSADGRTVLAAAWVPGEASDLTLDSAERPCVALGTAGAMGLTADLTSVRWQVMAPSVGTKISVCHRIDAAGERVAVLASGLFAPGAAPDLDVSPGQGQVLVLDANGVETARFAAGPGTERNACDVVVDAQHDLVVVAGWKQLFDWSDIDGSAGNATMGGPVQIPYLVGRSPVDGSIRWRAYDWHTDPGAADGRYLNEIAVASSVPDGTGRRIVTWKSASGIANNMADARLYRIALGADGVLVASGHSAGGNHLYRYSPADPTAAVGSKLANYDAFCSYAGAKSQHLGFIGRYALAADGVTFLGGQGLVARLSAISPNTLHGEGGGVAGDAEGRLYHAGTSAYGLPFAPNPVWKPLPGERGVNPFTDDQYTGGACLTAVHWDAANGGAFTRRDYTTRVAFGLARAVAVRSINGVRHLAWGGQARLVDGPIASVAALQPQPGYGANDGFLTVQIEGQDNGVAVVTTGLVESAAVMPGPRKTTGEAGTLPIRGGPAEVRANEDLDGDGVADTRLIYPWSLSAPLTPRVAAPASVTYDGPRWYGAIVADFAGVAPSKATFDSAVYAAAGSDQHLRITVSKAGVSGQKIRTCAALWLDPADLRDEAGQPLRIPGKPLSFAAGSRLSATFEKGWQFTDLDFNLLAERRLRFLVRNGTQFYVSQLELPWQGDGPAQWADHVLRILQDGNDGSWALWTPPANGVPTFAAATAEFASMDFQDLTGVGILVSDADWRVSPWTAPIPGRAEGVAAGRQPAIPSAFLRLEDFALRVASAAMSNQAPTVALTASATRVRLGDAVTFSASGARDVDGSVSYVTWDFADTVRTAGVTVTHTFTAAGRYVVTASVRDDRQGLAQGRIAVDVVRGDATDSEAAASAAVLSGTIGTGNEEYLAFKDEAIRRSDLDLDGDGTATDRLVEVPFAAIERPLTTQFGTRLFGALRAEGRAAGTTEMVNDWFRLAAQRANVSDQSRWAANGVICNGPAANWNKVGTGLRARLLWAIDRGDFLGAGATGRTALPPGSVLRAGPLSVVGPNSGDLRFVLREGNAWYVSQAVFVPPQAQNSWTGTNATNVYSTNENNGGLLGGPYGYQGATIGPNPRFELPDPASAAWAAWDPSTDIWPTRTGFAPRSFSDVTAFGVVLTLGDGSTWVEPANVTGINIGTLEMRAAVTPAAAPSAAIGAVPESTTAPGFITFSSPNVDGGRWRWDFGDGVVTEGTDAVVRHAFTRPGIYTVQVEARDPLDRSATARRLVTITASDGVMPQVGFTVTGMNLTTAGEAQLTVRRNGPLQGTVAVNWSVEGSASATRLSWGSGDASDRVVRVPATATLAVVLRDPEGGIGLANARAVITVPTTSNPPGNNDPGVGNPGNGPASGGSSGGGCGAGTIALLVAALSLQARRRRWLNSSVI